nr:hypothetical protein [Photobacterium leiognathi]
MKRVKRTKPGDQVLILGTDGNVYQCKPLALHWLVLPEILHTHRVQANTGLMHGISYKAPLAK